MKYLFFVALCSPLERLDFCKDILQFNAAKLIRRPWFCAVLTTLILTAWHWSTCRIFSPQVTHNLFWRSGVGVGNIGIGIHSEQK